jgi:hypothetical protein
MDDQVELIDNSKQDTNSTINLNLLPESCDRDSIVAEMTEAIDTAEPSVKNMTSNDEPTIDDTEAPLIEPETARANWFYSSAPPTVSSPLIDLLSPITQADPSSSVQQEVSRYKGEDVLLKELEDMGFKQIDLNKEVLRLNKYDLEQSVEDLCGLSEWDPLLEELKEMVNNGRPHM